MTALRLTASESEWITPFFTLEECISKSKIMLFSGSQWNEETLHQIEPDVEIKPVILISFDPSNDDLAGNYNLADLTVSVLVRDRNLRVTHLAYSGPATESHQTSVDLSQHFPGISTNVRFDIDVVLTKPLAADSETVLPKLALKRFVIDKISNNAEFPKEWRPPEDFEAEGVPRSTPWYIKWQAADIDLPIEQMVTLWINNAFKRQFLSISSDPEQVQFKRLLLSGILSEIISYIFKQAFELDDFHGQAPQAMTRKLKQSLGIEETDIRLAAAKPNFGAVTDAWALALVELHESLEEYDVN
jgi:hypothetical protein